MSLIILSQSIIPQDETLTSIALSSLKANLRFVLYEDSFDEEFGSIEIYIDKNYGKGGKDVEFFYINIHSQKFILEQSQNELIDIHINGEKYYAIAGTDNAHYPYLMYKFSLEYLKLNPTHLISIYDNYIFSLKDIENIEMSGGYYQYWTIKKDR